ncbi:hypothetical protein PENTCL1PPCAC_24318, partial [Pristionchus entomophagus]
VLLYSVAALPKKKTLEARIEELKAIEIPGGLTDHEAWNRFACQVLFGHVEASAECKKECVIFYKLKLDVTELPSKQITKGTEQSCTTECAALLIDGSESKRVCKSLCSIDFTFPDREQWMKELDEAVLH